MTDIVSVQVAAARAELAADAVWQAGATAGGEEADGTTVVLRA